jgi:cytochrome c oxidase cbb3-type subunit 3/ubiquinol-cytochrome c reductase cytochrome c subunit
MPAFARVGGGMLTALQVGILVKEIKGLTYKIGKDAVVADPHGISPAWGISSTVGAAAPPYEAPTGGAVAGARERGTRVFGRACAGCHGDRGEGVEVDGARRRRINDPAFLALISDQALRRYVITGRPDLGMPDYAGTAGRAPDFRALTATDVADLGALLSYWRQSGAR